MISKHLVYFLEGEDQLILPPGLLRLLFLQFLGALPPDVLHSCLHLVPHHGLLLLVQVVFLPRSLLLQAHSKLLCVQLIVFLRVRVFQFLVPSDPLKLLYFLCYFLHLQLSRLELAHLPIGISFPDDLIDLGPSVGLLPVNQDQSFSLAVGAGSTAGPMDVGVAVDWHSDLDNMADCEVEASRSHVGSDENITESGLLEFLELLYPLFLLHVRVQVHRLVAESLDEELDPFADFDGVAEDYGLAAGGQTLQVADHYGGSFDIALGEADQFGEALGQEQK